MTIKGNWENSKVGWMVSRKACSGKKTAIVFTLTRYSIEFFFLPDLRLLAAAVVLAIKSAADMRLAGRDRRSKAIDRLDIFSVFRGQLFSKGQIVKI